MTLTRRALFHSLGAGGTGPLSTAVIAARGREAMVAESASGLPVIPTADPDVIRISSNENPLGPGPAALSSLRGEYDQTNRYPMNATISDDMLMTRLAEKRGVEPENICLGPGSTEILWNSVRAFTGPDKPLVTAECSYEEPVKVADKLGYPVRAVPNTSNLGLDLDKMAGAAMGAGLVFFCNPNNRPARFTDGRTFRPSCAG